MLTQFLNKFRSNAPVCPTPREQETKTSRFDLGKGKDGKFFADPKYLHQLDDFQTHKQAADELNGHLALLAQIRDAVLPLEGSPLDLNPREEVVAVAGLPLNGMAVDAVIRHYSDTPSIEARVNDNGKTITLCETFEYLAPERKLEFGAEGRYYEVKDKNKGETYVDVKLTARK